MNNLLIFYNKILSKIEFLNNFVLFAIRLVLAYGFYITGTTKWQNIEGVAEWFESLNIPFPLLNAYLAASTEIIGVFLLTLGLTTRIISIPLIVVMLVAIFTVHISNGFEAANNGFEIPLYYLLLLLILLINGAGKLSIDSILAKRLSRNDNK